MPQNLSISLREFSFSRRMKGDPRNSIPRCNTAVSREDRSGFRGEENGQHEQDPESSNFSSPAKRKEEPSFSVSVSTTSHYRNKRKSRIDLRMIINRRVAGIDSWQLEGDPLTSDSKEDESLPSSFGKKHVRYGSGGPKIRRTYPSSRVPTQSSSLAEATNMSTAFDICFSDSIKQVMHNPLPDDNYLDEMLTMKHLIEEIGQVLRPGMVLLKNYIKLKEQVEIVKQCRELGLGPGGFYQPRFKDGAKLRLYMMCLGKDWDPQTKRYGQRRRQDGSKPPDIPPDLCLLVSRALQDSFSLIRRDLKASNVSDILPGISPNICIVNFYTTSGRLGLHQDRDESKESLLRGLPVVSVSIGDSAEFLYGDERDVSKAERVLLESGDVLIFGGKSRHIYHGVASIIPNTAPPSFIRNTKLRPGRLNLTFRQF